MLRPRVRHPGLDRAAKQKKGIETAKKSRKKGGQDRGTKLSKFIERFIRLSALAAAELESWEGD